MIGLHNRRRSYTVVFMANVSVAEAARRLGVGVPRIHKRIADGSLRAERIGSQWVVDELSLLRAAEHREPGRPLSARSAWAIIALAEGDDEALGALAPVERSRAKARLDELVESAPKRPSEDAVRRIAAKLRQMFRNRAERRLYEAAAADLPGLREDRRWQSLESPAASGIASSEVDGYVAVADLAGLERAFLLMPAIDEGNVVIHLLPEGQHAYPDSKLQLAADLAEHRGAREELRAAALLREMSAARPKVQR
jgi:excisionase family DNA binding protein